MLPKHVNHQFKLSNGTFEIVHFIASNKLALNMREESTQIRAMVDVTRDDLRAIRSCINSILGGE